MHRTALFLMLICVLAAPVAAQNGYPLPADLPVIEPSNATRLTQLASIGGTLPGGLGWSPDGSQLAVGTSAGVQVYDAEDWESPPMILPIAGNNFNIHFTADHLLSVNGQMWDTHSSEYIPPTPTAPPSTASVPTRRYLSPDGSVEALLDYQENVVVIHLVDAQNNPLASLKTGLDADVRGVLFSPDGQKLAVNLSILDPYYDEYLAATLQLWDIASGEQIQSWQSYGVVSELRFTDDSRKLLMVITDPRYEGLHHYGTLYIWDAKVANDETTLYIGSPEDYVQTSNGTFAVRSGQTSKIYLWTGDIMSLGEDSFCDDFETDELLFSADGSILISGIKCGERVLLWDVSGTIIPTKPFIELDSENLIERSAISPDETLIVTSEDGFIAKIWDAHTGVHQFDLEGEGAGVQFSPDGTLLRGIDSQQNIILWKATTGERLISLPPSALLINDWSQAVYWADTTTVRGIETVSGNATDLKIIDDYVGALSAFNAATSRVVFKNEGLQGYSLETGELFLQQPASFIEFSKNGDYFVTNSPSDDGLLQWKIWQSDHPEQPLRTFEMPYLRNFILSDDGKWFSEIDTCCPYRLWDAISGERQMYVYPSGLRGPESHAFSADGEWVVVGWDRSIDFVNIDEAVTEANKNEGRFLNSESSFTLYFNNRVQQLSLSPDGEQLAVTVIQYSPEQPMETLPPHIEIFSFDDLITTDGFQETREIPHSSIPNAQSVTFSPNSDYLLAENGLYDTDTGDLLASLSSATAAFNPSGTVLATTNDDDLMIWDMADLIEGHANPLATFAVTDVHLIAFNSSGTLLYIQRTGDIEVWAAQ